MVIGIILIGVGLICCALGIGTYIKQIPPFLMTNYIIGTKNEKNELKNDIKLCRFSGILLGLLGVSGILAGISVLANIAFIRYIAIVIVFIDVIYGLFKIIKGEMEH